MELTDLLPVLAWLQILPRLVSSEGTEGSGSSPASQLPTLIPAPPAPGLSLSPPSPVRGQQVHLTCSAPRGSGAVEFILYEQRSGRWERLESQRSGIWRISPENSELSRTFTCSYRVQSSSPRQPHSQSLQSDAVTLVLTEPLPAPALSLSPQHPVYVRGERVTLECWAPRGQEVAGYRFYKRHRGQAPEELPAGAMGPLEMLTVEMGDPSEYSCAYWILRASREIPSRESPPVPIAVIDPPPQPALSVDPPSGVVSEGLPLLITCMAPGDTSERRFHFYKDGAEIVPGDTGSEISTTEPSTSSMTVSVLSVLRAGPSNTGQFSCGYEVNMSGRWIPSPRSQAVNITVTAWSLPVPLVAGCGGAATALALLLLLIPLCRKKTAASRRLSM
ncbi:alpha-1B-glycoprotein-like [Malaclemys terrapin pileata]|uniref:alpha-1B-glycoprotein-like n=1 Tax=Malaclemys terrapin pileata TaxID=2991368 RepID=UPI0023A84743|nr:alpha-1B-glycoprotein-like [Malaclemys terrapin pileata]